MNSTSSNANKQPRNIVLHGSLNTNTIALNDSNRKSFLGFKRSNNDNWKQRYWRLIITDSALLLQKSRQKQTKPYKTITLAFGSTEVSDSWGKKGDTSLRFGFTLRYVIDGKTFRMEAAVDSRIARRRWMDVLTKVFPYKQVGTDSSIDSSPDETEETSTLCFKTHHGPSVLFELRASATSDLSIVTSANHLFGGAHARNLKISKNKRALTKSKSADGVDDLQQQFAAHESKLPLNDVSKVKSSSASNLCSEIAVAAAQERKLRHSTSLPSLQGLQHSHHSHHSRHHSHHSHHLHHHSHSARSHHSRPRYNCGPLRTDSVNSFVSDTTIFEGSPMAEHEFEDGIEADHGCIGTQQLITSAPATLNDLFDSNQPKLVLFEENIDEEDKERPILHTCKVSPCPTDLINLNSVGQTSLRLGGRSSEICPITPYDEAANGSEDAATHTFDNVKLTFSEHSEDTEYVTAGAMKTANIHKIATKTATIHRISSLPNMHKTPRGCDHDEHEPHFSLGRNTSFRSVSSCATIWSILNDKELSEHHDPIHPIPIFVPSS